MVFHGNLKTPRSPMYLTTSRYIPMFVAWTFISIYPLLNMIDIHVFTNVPTKIFRVFCNTSWILTTPPTLLQPWSFSFCNTCHGLSFSHVKRCFDRLVQRAVSGLFGVPGNMILLYVPTFKLASHAKVPGLFWGWRMIGVDVFNEQFQKVPLVYDSRGLYTLPNILLISIQ